MNNANDSYPSAPPAYSQPNQDTNFQSAHYPQTHHPNINQSTIPNQFQQTPQLNREEKFRHIIQKYEISEKFANKLQILNGFKIVYIFDDSGSMSNVLDDSPLNIRGNLMKARRWDELQYYSNISIEISSLFNQNGCDVYFLNRGVIKNVKSSWDLERYFQTPPQGYTPLRDTFNSVINDNIQATRENKLLVVIITDGEPTDRSGVKSEINEFKICLQNRHPIHNIFVTIVACTDDDSSIKYLDKWDREIKNLDVVDDFRSERDQIHKAKGYSFMFTFGDYVVKSLIGSIDPELDNLDDSKLCCCTIS